MFSLGDTLRDLFFWLDGIIYGLVAKIYYLFYMLIETTIFSADTIASFTSRVYILISLIMAFRLAFSFINYIVSPDSFSDKQKGGGKLIKNIVVSVALLAAVPTIFNEAYYLQGVIINDNIIPSIILGDVSSNADFSNEDVKLQAANQLAGYTFLTFISPSPRATECKNAIVKDSTGGITLDSKCKEYLNSKSVAHILGENYSTALSSGNISDIISSSDKNSTTTEETPISTGYSEKQYYLLDYQWGISTIAGGFLCFVLLGFCFDASVRIIKLGFLQLIAPIPIVMSLSPDKKSGDTLSKWGKECLSTWASMFIRIAVISFAFYFITIINNEGGIISFIRGGEENQNLFVSVFVIFGILLFAKEFPKLLEDILGFKGSGKLTLNPWKKLGTVPLVGGAATAGLTMAGAGALAAGRGIFGLGKSAVSGLGSKLNGGSFKDGAKESLGDTASRMSARMKAGLSSSKEKVTSAGFKGTDKLGGSMHKAYGENYRNKDYKKTTKAEELGEKLYKGVADDISNHPEYSEEQKKDAKYNIYKSKEFATSARDMDTAKERRDMASSNYEKAKMRYENGEGGDVDTVDKLRIDSLKAASDYDKLKSEFDRKKVIYKSDADRYSAYSAAEDKYKSIGNVNKFREAQNPSSSPSYNLSDLANQKVNHTQGYSEEIKNELSREQDKRTVDPGNHD